MSSKNEEKISESEPCLLVSAAYDNQKRIAVLKLYNPKTKKILLVDGDKDHKPYCYSKQSVKELEVLRNEISGIEKIQSIELHDSLRDEKIIVSKIICHDPLVVGGKPDSIRNRISTWESDIKYYENYLYDKQLIVGKYYTVKNNELIKHDFEISNETKIALKNLLWDKINLSEVVDSKEFLSYISDWAELLNQPIPKIKRLSLDIEVESEVGRIPDSKLAENKIIAIGMDDGENYRKILVLRKEGTDEGIKTLPKHAELQFFEKDEEVKMIKTAFEKITEYPFLITFNGDEFDLPYLYHRARNLNINFSEIPLTMMRNSATTKKGVHLDLYRTFFNRSFQIYAFSNKYSNFSLNSISKALLNREKLDFKKDFDALTLNELASYCYNDAEITYELTSFNHDLLMNLLVVIARIARMPVDDIARVGVSQWIRSLLYFEHRKTHTLIPQRKELEERTPEVTINAVIKDKKYRGGLVIEPKEGIHFKVVVMDFASLYPSIVKVRNLSYETVRCPHDECKKNIIPQTSHWACTRKNGMGSLLIGSLRDLRVNYYKSLSKNQTFTDEQRQQYTVVSQALKVILNASYGVMGAEIFPLYFLPVAESTTAIGRYIILETIKNCETAGIEVLYGDTDSLFLKNPTEEQIKQVIDEAQKDHRVELEVDKEYRYVVLSTRKKNYLGVTKDGKVDVKGLTGKKSHTPPFIKKLFFELTDILSKVKTNNDFKSAKNQISQKIAIWAKKVQEKDIPLEDLTFNVTLSKSPKDYTKTIPQHIRAANLLKDIREVRKGEIISFIKTINKPGVKPVEMARQEEVDSKKYMEFMESTFDQFISVMDLDFDTIVGRPKQTGLDQFFWN